MSQLKEQNGRYYQEVEVVMLATDKPSHIHLLDGSIWHYKNQDSVSFGASVAQHLYFLSDDKIKVGDYVVETLTTGELEVFKIDTLNDIDLKTQRKIIATTDKSLEIRFENHNDFDSVFELPKPSNSFIKKYIEEYNAGKQITKVLVEYVKHPIENYWYLHTDSDYEITIKKVKNSYSREKVERMLEDAVYFGANHGNPLNYSTVKQYIKENL